MEDNGFDPEVDVDLIIKERKIEVGEYEETGYFHGIKMLSWNEKEYAPVVTKKKYVHPTMKQAKDASNKAMWGNLSGY